MKRGYALARFPTKEDHADMNVRLAELDVALGRLEEEREALLKLRRGYGDWLSLHPLVGQDTAKEAPDAPST